ncbi:MAG: hypothetical protein V7677_18690, partial [Motiliproteus sp.]
MNNLFDIQPILPALTSGQLVLTPNRRLAAKILDAYNNHQAQQSVRSWNTPNVYPLEAWIHNCWEELQDINPLLVPRRLIDSRQELLLWEQVITKDQESSPLLKPSGAASQAQSAYRTLCLWRQQVNSEQYLSHALDADVFAQWVNTFETLCEQHDWMIQPQLIELLITACSPSTLDSQRISHCPVKQSAAMLVAFQEMPPLHQQFLDCYCQSISHYQPVTLNLLKTRLSCNDNDQEIALSAQWARQVLLQAPGSTIGIIIPELQNLRAKVEHDYRQLFDLDYFDPQAEIKEPPFNISIGTSLLDAPVIHFALKLLGYRLNTIDIGDLGGLLYSPFMPGLESELDGRTQLEYRLRRLGKSQFK